MIKRLAAINWWAIASVIMLLAMVYLTMFGSPDAIYPAPLAWIVTLGFASVVCSIFSVKESLDISTRIRIASNDYK